MDVVALGSAAEPLSVGFRPATAEDESMVFSAWLLGHRDRGDWPKRIGKGRYFDEHKVTVARILAAPGTRCLVACNPARPGQAFGFVAHGADRVLHWLYVKEMWRRNGIARELLKRTVEPAPGSLVHCSHWTVAASALRTGGRNWIYDPFLIEGVK